MIRRPMFLAGLSLGLALSSCANDNVAGKPAGSETSDEVVARILDTAGQPLVFAEVHVRPHWYTVDSNGRPDHYDWTRVIDTRTDSAGRLSLKLPQGAYRIEVRSFRQGLIIPVEIGKDRPPLGDQRAQPLGGVFGRATLPKGARHAWIRFFGLDYSASTDDSGRFFLPAVPPGDSGILMSATVSANRIELGEGRVRIVPHQVVQADPFRSLAADGEDYTTWRSSVAERGLASEVAKSGAGNGTPVTVLVRLDRSNFDFASAAGDGRDLRFALPDGRHLPYVPRFYDSAGGVAHIDVRLPSLASGNAPPTIQVLSGRDGVPSRADSAGVWSGIPDSLRLAATTFLVADFSEPSIRAQLPIDIAIGPWYLGVVGKAVLVSPASTSASVLPCIQAAGQGRAGNAFDLEYTSTDTSAASYVVLGTNIDATSRSFQALDSVVFWARGNSRFWFALEDSLAVSKKAWIKLSTTSAWTRYCVKPGDFLPAGGTGNTGWVATRNSIRRFSFIVSGGSNFRVTDIRVYGLGVDEMR